MPSRRTITSHQQHYARLLVTPLPSDPTCALKPIDRISVLQLASKALLEWFGAVGGGATGHEIEVLLVETSRQGDEKRRAAGGEKREVVLRFPSSAAMSILTALPLSSTSYDGQAYRIQVLAASSDLGSLAGAGGRGPSGFQAWVGSLRKGQ